MAEPAEITLEDLKEAQQRINGVARTTPCYRSALLSNAYRREIFLKLENLQVTGSYKVRGALNFINKLPSTVKGLITASAGNHAQGVAFAARERSWQEKTWVLMAHGASAMKKERTEAYGVHVLAEKEWVAFDDANNAAKARAENEDLVFVPAFNHPDVIAGQGTIGLEIHEQCPDAAFVIVPVGGGGLASGVAQALSLSGSGAKVLGVEAEGAAPFYHNFHPDKGKLAAESTHPRPLKDKPSTIADGISVRQPGDVTWKYVERLIGAQGIFTVAEREIGFAIMALAEAGVYAEGAGATPLAFLEAAKNGDYGQHPIPEDATVVLVVSGANVAALDYLRYVNFAASQKNALLEFRVPIEDKAGSLAQLLQPIAELGLDIADVDFLRWRGGGLGRPEAVIGVVISCEKKQLEDNWIKLESKLKEKYVVTRIKG